MTGSLTRWLVNVVILTLGMGTAVAISWFAFASRYQSFGLDPASVLTVTRLTVYGSQCLFVAAFAFLFTSRRLRAITPAQLAGLVGTAWVGEGIVLTLIGEPIVANELDPAIAWYYWLVATAGPLQPAAAFAGGWLGIRRSGYGR